MTDVSALVEDAKLEGLHPLISPEAGQQLRSIIEHPQAPKWTHAVGDRLDSTGLSLVQAFAKLAPATWSQGGKPAWLHDFLGHAVTHTPQYKAYPNNFDHVPTVSRQNLSRDVVSFVPDDANLDGLIDYTTSGTTGHPIVIPSHPTTASMYLPLVMRALESVGVALEPGVERMASILVCDQQYTVTHASAFAALGNALNLKINLNAESWRRTHDREAFIEHCNPQIFTGDPISLMSLAAVDADVTPKALVSTAMTLTNGVRHELQQRFNCPIIDLYSMNECGPIAFRAAPGPWTLLQPRLFVEVLDENGAMTDSGEITVTGGLSKYLPLLRYRTGDHGILKWNGDRPYLAALSGRQPVLFRSGDGRLINSVDITQALTIFVLPNFGLHQNANGSFLFMCGHVDRATIVAAERALRTLLGDAPIHTLVDDATTIKAMYTSQLAEKHFD